jgi:hypothetical protein
LTEIRNAREGALYWLAASGSGSAWATASGASGRLLAYVQSFTWTSGKTVNPVFDRGTLSHWKATDNGQPISLSFAVLYAVTGNWPTSLASGSGATVPMAHLEFKMTAPEAGAAQWYQFHGCPIDQLQFGEEANANTQTITMRALAMVGPTGSGYIGA